MNVYSKYIKPLYIITLMCIVTLSYRNFHTFTVYDQQCSNSIPDKTSLKSHEQKSLDVNVENKLNLNKLNLHNALGNISKHSFLKNDSINLKSKQQLDIDKIRLKVNELKHQHVFKNYPQVNAQKISQLIMDLRKILKIDGINLESSDQKVLKIDKVKHTATVSAQNVSSNKVTCDSECQRFRRLLSNWTDNHKPKAVIHLLVRTRRISQLYDLLGMLDKFFNNQFHYPVVLFHEEEFKTPKDRIRRATKSDIYFQKVKFEEPEFLHKSQKCVIGCVGYPIGYRHMCRFHAYTIYQEPILQGVDYFWRLDDDSVITKPIKYDVFKVMHDKNYLYGYVIRNKDDFPWIAGLWTIVREYAHVNSIKFKFELPERDMFFNNFEISARELWLSEEYQKYIQFIDQTAGIYYYRWGDSPIKSLAVSLFVPLHKLHHFSDIGYRHGDFFQE